MSTSVNDLLYRSFIDHRLGDTIDTPKTPTWHILSIEQQTFIASHKEFEEKHHPSEGMMPLYQIDKRATLLQAMDLMQAHKTDRLVISHREKVLGILSREQVQRFYQDHCD